MEMENRPLVSRGLEGGKGGEAAVNIKSSVRIPVMELSCISALVVLRQTDTHMFRLHGTKHRHTNHTHTQLSLCKTGEMWIRWMSCVRANLLMVISCCSFIRRCILGLFGVSLYFFFIAVYDIQLSLKVFLESTVVCWEWNKAIFLI